jgi:hypothetical protein
MVYDSTDPRTQAFTSISSITTPESFGVRIDKFFGPIVTGTDPAAPGSIYGTSSEQYRARLSMRFTDAFSGADDLSFTQGEQVLEFGQVFSYQGLLGLVPATGYGTTLVYNRAATFGPSNPGNASLVPSVVPLPAGLPLALAGLGALGLMRRRKRAA